MTSTLFSFVVLFILGLVLGFIKNRTEKVIYNLSFLLFGSVNPGIYIYFIIFLPGIILHELSHLFMAAIFGVRVGELKLFPEKISKGQIQLGKVITAETNPLKESLIGLAPLFSGIGAIIFIAYFGLNFPLTLSVNSLSEIIHGLTIATGGRLLISGYGIFVFSNTMFLSESDRRSWVILPVILALIISLLYFFNILSNQILESNIQKVTNDIAITFVFSIFVDTIFFLPMGLINYILTKNRNG